MGNVILLEDIKSIATSNLIPVEAQSALARRLKASEPALECSKTLLLDGQHRRVYISIRRDEVGAVEAVANSNRLLRRADGRRTVGGDGGFAPWVACCASGEYYACEGGRVESLRWPLAKKR